MVLVPYLGKYFGRKAAYWGECATLLALMREEERGVRSLLGVIRDLWLTNGDLYRLGEVHGVEIPRRGGVQ